MNHNMIYSDSENKKLFFIFLKPDRLLLRLGGKRGDEGWASMIFISYLKSLWRHSSLILKQQTGC